MNCYISKVLKQNENAFMHIPIQDGPTKSLEHFEPLKNYLFCAMQYVNTFVAIYLY